MIQVVVLRNKRIQVKGFRWIQLVFYNTKGFRKKDSALFLRYKKRIQDSGLFFTTRNDSEKRIQLCFYVTCPKNGVYILNPATGVGGDVLADRVHRHATKFVDVACCC